MGLPHLPEVSTNWVCEYQLDVVQVGHNFDPQDAINGWKEIEFLKSTGAF